MEAASATAQTSAVQAALEAVAVLASLGAAEVAQAIVVQAEGVEASPGSTALWASQRWMSLMAQEEWAALLELQALWRLWQCCQLP